GQGQVVPVRGAIEQALGRGLAARKERMGTARVGVRHGDFLDQGAPGGIFVEESEVRVAAQGGVAVAALNGDQVARRKRLADGFDERQAAPVVQRVRGEGEVGGAIRGRGSVGDGYEIAARGAESRTAPKRARRIVVAGREGNRGGSRDYRRGAHRAIVR